MKKSKKIKGQPGKKKGGPKQAPGTIVVPGGGNSKKAIVPNQDKRMGGSGGSHPHATFHHAVCGQTDPFCSHALGARIPDGNAGRSLTFQVRGNQVVSTNAAGAGGCLLVAEFPYNSNLLVGTANTTTLTFPPTLVQFPAASAFSASVGNWRCVSFGVKVSSILNATNNSGYIVIASTATVPSTVTVPDMEYDDAVMIPLNNFKGITWISKRLSNYNLYAALGGNSVSYPFTSDNYTKCVVTMIGQANVTAAVLIEFVANYEFTPLPDTASAMLAQKGPVKNDAVLTGASHVQNVIAATAVKGAEDVGSDILKLVKASPLGMIASIGSELLKAL